MILIISTATDITTNQVAEWLVSAGCDFRRLNTDKTTPLDQFRLSNGGISLSLDHIGIKDIKAVWHRRGRLKHIPEALENTGNIYTYIKKEEDSLIKSIEHLLRTETTYTGSYEKEAENFKIDYLVLARSAGLEIPETLITTEKKALVDFFNTHEFIITKDIRYPINLTLPEAKLSSAGTFVVTQDMIDRLNESFAPVFVQEKVEKIYEIRIFFFRNTYYPMAIFSQNDGQTATDYRNYNEKKPNRCIPVSLPEDIGEKVRRFVEETSLTTGSIDMIYSKYEQYVFLEVNPMGQLDWVSKNCNYYIEKEIAEALIKTQ